MSSLESSESPSFQAGLKAGLPAGLQAGLQATAAPQADNFAPQTEDWQPVAALRSAPQEAIASTFVGVVRNWVGYISPQRRLGL